MFQKIANVLSIISFIMVASMSGGTYFAYKYFTSEQFKSKMMNEILENVLLDSMYNLPSTPEVSKVVVDEAVIEGETQPILIYDQNSAEKSG